MPPCRYEDGDEEEVELHELERILVPAGDGFSKGAGGKSSGTAAKGGGSKRNDTAATGGGRAQRGGKPAGKGEGRKRKKAAESPAPSGGAEQPAEEEEDAEQAAAAVQHAMQQDGEEQQQATEPLLKEEQEGEAELHAWLGNAAKPLAGRAPLASPSSERGPTAQLHGIADEVATRSKELVRACDGQAGACAAAQVGDAWVASQVVSPPAVRCALTSAALTSATCCALVLPTGTAHAPSALPMHLPGGRPAGAGHSALPRGAAGGGPSAALPSGHLRQRELGEGAVLKERRLPQCACFQASGSFIHSMQAAVSVQPRSHHHLSHMRACAGVLHLGPAAGGRPPGGGRCAGGGAV